MRMFGNGVYKGALSSFHPLVDAGDQGLNSFDIRNAILANTWATFGPIGSGADVETDSLSPYWFPEKGIIGIRGLLFTSNRFSATSTFGITVWAVSTDVETPIIGSGSRKYTDTIYPGVSTAQPFAEGSQRETEVILPFGKDGMTKLRWQDSGTGVSAASFTPVAPVF